MIPRRSNLFTRLALVMPMRRSACLVSVALVLSACAKESAETGAGVGGGSGVTTSSGNTSVGSAESSSHGSGSGSSGSGGLRDAGPGQGGALATNASVASETSAQSSGYGGGSLGSGGPGGSGFNVGGGGATNGNATSGSGTSASGMTSSDSSGTVAQSVGVGGSIPGDGGLPDAGVDAGKPGKDPLDSPAQCTSKVTWKSGMDQTMRPGEACPTCHTNFHLAGTLYPTGHEPNDCDGVDGLSDGVMVVITGADGQVLTLYPNTVGNFYTSITVAKPFQAKVVLGGKERAMQTPQTVDSCNSCHTQTGANGAPGRITLPD